MADETLISWADSTFNPWVGCTRVSPACDGCYAAHLMGHRLKRVVWGEPGKGDGTRDRTKPGNWRKPKMWNRQAAHAPGKHFVFCASLADVFDNAVDPTWRRDLFALIEDTPNLTWLLLTKRPGMIVKLFEDACGLLEDVGWPKNAAIGCTVINQEEADRDIPKLLRAKTELRPAFAFLSMEPLMGPVDLTKITLRRDGQLPNEMSKSLGDYVLPLTGAFSDSPRIDWVIAGGETDQGNHKARPADPAWFRSLRDQCAAAGVPFHFKQWGEWVSNSDLGAVAVVPEGVTFDPFDPDRTVLRAGSDHDPHTLDGVEHFARPEVVR